MTASETITEAAKELDRVLFTPGPWRAFKSGVYSAEKCVAMGHPQEEDHNFGYITPNLSPPRQTCTWF